jgi:chemotaxis protein methyltransferase WspC
MMQMDFAGLLREAIGLDADSIGGNALERALRGRMATLGVTSVENYWSRLQGSADELQELIEAVVVPETWFFRDREAFSSMARWLCRSLLSASSASPIRILSVPCCTGEEPYSLAMTLFDAGLPSNNFAIDAVDVSQSAIMRGRRGLYGSNSFRGDDLEFRERHMERSGELYRVREEVRRAVTFHHDNLFSESFRQNSAPYDVIFCRNVLIYFDREKQGLALDKLKRLLKPKGLLFVGPAEAVLAGCSGFRPLNEELSFAFAKEQSSSAKKPPAKRPRLATESFRPKREHPLPASSPAPSKSQVTGVSSPARTGVRNEIAEIQDLADTAQFDRALALCKTYLDKHTPTEEAFYLRGLIHDARNETASAIEWYRKAVYLNPTHSEALLHLALLYEREGNVGGATQLRERAKRSGWAEQPARDRLARGNNK